MQYSGKKVMCAICYQSRHSVATFLLLTHVCHLAVIHFFELTSSYAAFFIGFVLKLKQMYEITKYMGIGVSVEM